MRPSNKQTYYTPPPSTISVRFTHKWRDGQIVKIPTKVCTHLRREKCLYMYIVCLCVLQYLVVIRFDSCSFSVQLSEWGWMFWSLMTPTKLLLPFQSSSYVSASYTRTHAPMCWVDSIFAMSWTRLALPYIRSYATLSHYLRTFYVHRIPPSYTTFANEWLLVNRKTLWTSRRC